jgi:inorganic triphosphatase YgiF
MSVETELKLSLAPEYADQLVRHPLLQSATLNKAPQYLYNIYFDTPEHALLQQGFGLRVRRIGEKRLQTLKTADHALGGLHKRQEWETEVLDDVPDYNRFPNGALPSWCADEENRSQIKPLFTTDFLRTTWDLTFDDGSLIEVALDQGVIKTSTAHFPLSEVELELKAGSPIKLYKVALTLQKQLPLLVENKSKAAHGYALHKPSPPTVYKADKIKLHPEMSAEMAFIHIFWQTLMMMQENEDVVLYGEDIEGVHQMRVALRRLRSCLNLYEPIIPKKSHVKLHGEMKWLTALLGEARDWDVFALNLSKMLVNPPQPELGNPLSTADRAVFREQLTQLQTRVAEYQSTAYVKLREALRSPRYSRLLLLLGKWLNQRSWRERVNKKTLQQLDGSVTTFASQVIDEQYQEVCQQGKNLIQLSPTQRHHVRILVKKLAYGTRFFTTLYAKKATRQFQDNLAELQEQLGILNDTNVANQLVSQLQLTDDDPVRLLLISYYNKQKDKYVQQLELCWQAFLQQPKFW